MESGFIDALDNHNIFRDKFTGADLINIKDVIDKLIADSQIVHRNLKNPFTMSLFSKNVIESLLHILIHYKSVFYDRNLQTEFESACSLMDILTKEFSDCVENPVQYLSPYKNKRAPDNITITFKIYDTQDFPKGDNREFSITGPHGYSKFMEIAEDRYKYRLPILIIYRNGIGESITVDSDEVYQKCLKDALFDSFNSRNEVSLYVKPFKKKWGGDYFADENINPWSRSIRRNDRSTWAFE